MKHYIVSYSYRVHETIGIDAHNEDEALDIVRDEIPYNAEINEIEREDYDPNDPRI